MCGIAGIHSGNNGHPRDALLDCQLMIKAIEHRGPDDHGIWHQLDSSPVFGHRRLSIMDLSAKGHQPMTSHCGRYVITYNGEIYNFRQIRDRLGLPASSFNGHSDTEVLLEAIAQWGIDKTLGAVVGMFAFAVWDNGTQMLTLARDRAGEKPLYYTFHSGSFYFASEIKALRALDTIPFDISENSIRHYLTFGYVPSPLTIYQNVHHVPPGHYMTVDMHLKIRIQSYWRPPTNTNNTIDFPEAVATIDELLRESIRGRLVADVPVGCFLSGGIDSGLITALASELTDGRLKTFTVSFDDNAVDEAPAAQLTADRYSTAHTILKLRPNIQELLPSIARAYDQPFADASAIPSYCISREAARHVTVILNGEGSDEILGGYRRQLAASLASRFRPMFQFMPRRLWRSIVSALPQPTEFRSPYAFLHRFARGVCEDLYSRYLAWCADGFTDGEKALLYAARLPKGQTSAELIESCIADIPQERQFERFMSIDFLFNMPNDMLVKMDIATMAHGIEARCPFLDHRLVEYAFTVPASVKMRGYGTKPVLRALAARYLPEKIATAPKKGFEIPLIRWIRRDISAMIRDTCLSSNGILLHIFRRKAVEDILFERTRLDTNRWSKQVWILFMLALWDQTNR